MKLIQPSVELYPQENYTLEGIYKQIEKCARVSYKSEDKITDTSSKAFVDNLIKAGHYAPLEFGTVYLTIPVESPLDDPQYIFKMDIVNFFSNNPYSKINKESAKSYLAIYYITTNWRVIFENKDELMCKNIFEYYLIETESLEKSILQFLTKPTEHHEKRYTVKFTCDIGVAREFTRHRVFSFMQESTRYCNYSKSKFNEELTFIKPYWFKESQLPIDLNVAQNSDTNGAVFYERTYKAYWIDTDAEGFDWHREDFFIHSCQVAEKCYLLELEEGAKPQEARQVLPLATKTELVMCGFESDWKHFFDLRLRGITGAPHPDAKEIAQTTWNLFKENYGIEL